MSPAPHRVRRLRLELSAATPGEAFEQRARLRDGVLEAVLPCLEAAFDQVAPGEELVRLGRLELSVRVKSLDEIARVLPDLLRRELAARVRGGVLGVDTERIERVPRALARAEALRHYLAGGALPWHAGAANVVLAQLGAPDAEPLLAAAATVLAELSLSQRSSAWFRLLQALPDERWGDATSELLQARAPQAYRSLSIALHALSEVPDWARHDRLRFGAVLLAAADAKAPGRSDEELCAFLVATGSASEAVARVELDALPDIVRSAFRQLGVLSPAAPTDARTPQPATTPAPPDARASASNLSTARARTVSAADVNASHISERADATRVPRADPIAVAPPSASPTQRTDRTPLPEPSEPPAAAALSSTAREPRPPEQPSSGVAPSPSSAFGRVAPYAGLILLHPFLSRFFVHTGIRREAEPALEPHLLPRAAALLHACAGASGEPFEPELTFIKALLGLELDATLLVGSGLVSDADRGEIDGLLRAVIDHFTVLRKTSPDGLRATFLQRGGLVREDERGYRLQVEPSSFDVLLAHLPWGIGIVKLPWSRKAIYTEWISP